MIIEPQDKDAQEIDLSNISKSIGGIINRLSAGIYYILMYFKRNIILIVVLIIAGVGLGIILDRTSRIYDNEVIVAPNFNSTDYLYAKINLVKSKISERDTVFLKEVVGFPNPKNVKNIKIEPITDVYQFIAGQEENFELIKLMAENDDIKKILEDDVTSKNYPYHRILFVTAKTTSNETTVNPLIQYLNTSEYYNKVRDITRKNIQEKVIRNDATINQIDGILESFASNLAGSGRGDKLVYYNENTQLNDVIKTKDELISEQGSHRLSLENTDKVIKDLSTTINVKNKSVVNGSLKLILPVLFLLIYFLIVVFLTFFKKEAAKHNAIPNR